MRTPRRTVAAVAIAAALATVATSAAPAAASTTAAAPGNGPVTAAAAPSAPGGVVLRAQRRAAAQPKLPAAYDHTAPRGSFFGPTSVWKQDVRKAPVNPRSAAMVAGLHRQVTTLYNGVAAFNVSNYSTNVYTVSGAQRRVDVAFDDCQKKKYTPAGLLGAGGQFTGVPIPDDAVPARGSDGQLTIYSPSTDQLWEFWRAKRVDGRWQACWGGRIDAVSTSPGYFSGGFGAAATGLSFSAGAIGIKDVQAGSIDHALSLQIVEPKKWTTFSWPAQRSDGFSTDPDAIPEGLRLRLDPAVDVESLKLTPIGKMVARAAQKYGFIVTDKAGAVALTAESGTATANATGVDPWPALMRGKPHYEIMRGFPWDKLQALPENYGKP
ncbi:DUF4124 domain-containing protein [Kineococcus gypseus]|uniref:DUF4124 domain-containing protein n=1 Tax=Kineococcus gypseus TaxID=1637102 RepID=UPI003D7C7AEA